MLQYPVTHLFQSDKDYIIREITKREAPIKDLKVGENIVFAPLNILPVKIYTEDYFQY